MKKPEEDIIKIVDTKITESAQVAADLIKAQAKIAENKLNNLALIAENKIAAAAVNAAEIVKLQTLLAENKINATALSAASTAADLIKAQALSAASTAADLIKAQALIAEDKITSSSLLAADKLNATALVASEKILAAALVAENKMRVVHKRTTIGFIILGIISLLTIVKIVTMDIKDNKRGTTIISTLVDIKKDVEKLTNSDSIMNIQLQHYPATDPIKIITKVTSSYSERINPISKLKEFHYGIDYAAKAGTPVYATGDGVIEEAKIKGGFGKTVKIDHENSYKSLYGHLSKILVKQGEAIKRGDTLGFVGSSGYSTGNHLHYEIYYGYIPVNPIIFK